MRLWVDTGHQNADSGAVGGGTTEVKRNDLLADEVERLAKIQGWKVGYTDEKDTRTSLLERVNDAKAFHADLFVSIHHDWTEGDQAVIFAARHDVATSKRLADHINDQLDVKGDGIPNAGIYADRRGLAVLKYTDMPAVIIEASRIQDDYVVKKMAERIVRGICSFKGVTYRETPKVRPYPGHVIQKGDHGDDVFWIQRRLIHHGYHLPRFGADGGFGGETQTAVRKFHDDLGWDGNGGKVGPATWAALAKP